MNAPLPSLDDRIRAALHDLDARVAEHLGPVRAPARRPARRHRSRVLLPVGAALAVLVVVGALGFAFRPGADAPSLPPVATRSPAPSPSITFAPPATGSSQSRADADRDHVVLGLAKLSLAKRLRPVEPLTATPTSLRAPDGSLWVISSPDLQQDYPGSSYPDGEGRLCRPIPSGLSQGYELCDGYTEVLHLTPDGSRVLRAYPLPDVAPEWLVLSSGDLYCGTVQTFTGGGSAAMLCRIDLSTGDLSGELLPCSPGGCATMTRNAGTVQGDGITAPGSWVVVGQEMDLSRFARAEARDGDLTLLSAAGRLVARFDGATLMPASWPGG